MIFLFLILFPMLAGILRPKLIRWVTGIELAVASMLFMGFEANFPQIMGMGLSFKADSFRALYATLAAIMWFMTSLFSREYFLGHSRNLTRYYSSNLVTLGAVMGVFTANDLFTVFVFFEIMSIASYPWVAHDETRPALRAAATYLTVAVVGGMATLMGLFLLYSKCGTLDFVGLREACAGLATQELLPAAVLTLTGFAAKAGAFPLHIWLPKAHPVAPAPASALLSGMLTKTGVFGAMILMVYVAPDALGGIVFYAGIITMLLGAVLALFSIDLKRTLACSSVSQIGFIFVGVGLISEGAVLHMVNHSLIKLVLFMLAGAIYMRTRALNLNDIRGYGRKKPWLAIPFLIGGLSLGGVPPFGGYFSKTLLHEAIIASAAPAWCEWAFLLSGGLTIAYMTKLFTALFIERNPVRQAEFDADAPYSPLTKLALGGSAAAVLLAGALNVRISNLGESFLGFTPEPIEFFSAECLSGAGISLAAGAIVYFLIVRPFMIKGREYKNLWPAWLDLENGFYRPLFNAFVIPALSFLAGLLDKFTDTVCPACAFVASAAARACSECVDFMALTIKRTVLRARRSFTVKPVGTRFTDALGQLMDTLARRLGKKRETSFVSVLAAGIEEASGAFRRVARSLSFGILLFCAGLLITLIWIFI